MPWKIRFVCEVIVPNKPDVDSIMDFLAMVSEDASNANTEDVEVTEVQECTT
jgi:hypothetical protein